MTFILPGREAPEDMTSRDYPKSRRHQKNRAQPGNP